ncbi:hypothetical protein Dsin_014510 [Dipteronia sinensis]|uniref:Uncharacterized protein n=1 Tax=Dipteronia sinensis TaxID=43782 RepID=A0AAE0E9W9_9ROSI|nr:hypothetical protein Dsin_014508 [Dipteronia sinensis]KAK3220540.1 hypothetical protein Dsin_014510 [Dipteronia sinensis]
MVVSFEDLTNVTMNYKDRSKDKASCEDFLQYFLDIGAHETQRNPSLLLIHNAMKLVNELQTTAPNQEERWKRIGNTWMEMLGYAARRSKSYNHTQQLRRGGEFITHVWLLLAYFGLTDHFQMPSLPRPDPLVLTRLIAK